MRWICLKNMEQKNAKLPTYLMKTFLVLTNFLLNLCNFHEDEGVILILQSHFLGDKKSSQPMNFHFLTILGMLTMRKNRDRMPKELIFLNEEGTIIFMLLLSQVEE